MRTITVKPSDVDIKWYIIDASDKVLGRLASEVAMRLKGKRKPEYTPNMNHGDHIVIVNAEKIRVTGNKREDKLYFSHSEYPGGDTQTPFKNMKPERIIEIAVKGMLPKGPLGSEMFRKLHVYQGSRHPHASQQPETLNI